VIRAIVAAVALALVLSLSAAAQGYYVSLNQAAPVFGSMINFSETYPQAAAKQAKNTGFGPSPHTQVDCWQADVLVYEQQTRIVDKTKIADGWLGITGDLILQQYGTALPWPGGGANCSVTTYYLDSSGAFVQIASAAFDVAP
jgi:hypothetical protein